MPPEDEVNEFSQVLLIMQTKLGNIPNTTLFVQNYICRNTSMYISVERQL